MPVTDIVSYVCDEMLVVKHIYISLFRKARLCNYLVLFCVFYIHLTKLIGVEKLSPCKQVELKLVKNVA